MKKSSSIISFLAIAFFLQWCENINQEVENQNITQTWIIIEDDFFESNEEELFNEDEYEIIEDGKINQDLWANVWKIKFEWSNFEVINVKNLYQFSWFIPSTEWTVTINWEEYNENIEQWDTLNDFNIIIWNNDEYLIFDSVSFKFYSLENISKSTIDDNKNISFNIYYEWESNERKSQVLYDILNRNKDFKIKYKYSLDKHNWWETWATITVQSETINIDGDTGINLISQ